MCYPQNGRLGRPQWDYMLRREILSLLRITHDFWGTAHCQVTVLPPEVKRNLAGLFISVRVAIYGLVFCFSVMKQDSTNHCSFSIHFHKHFVHRMCRMSGSKKCVKYLLGPEGHKRYGGVSLLFNCNTHASHHFVIQVNNKSFRLVLWSVL